MALAGSLHLSPLWAAPAQRVVSLSPHLTEWVLALGAASQLIATDSASQALFPRLHLPVVANYRSVQAEAVLQLSPDLILAWQNPHWGVTAPLRAFNLPTFYSEPKQFADFNREILALGARLGREAAAKRVAANFSAQLQVLRATYQARPPVRLFYQAWPVPLTSVNGQSWVGQALALCAGDNIMAAHRAPYPQVNLESVLISAPALILAPPHSDLSHWRAWPQLSAVKNQQLRYVDLSLIERFSPDTPRAIATLCRRMHRLPETN
ncbi:MAG: ABC transporter substrate-binding protein [Aeromonas sp.]